MSESFSVKHVDIHHRLRSASSTRHRRPHQQYIFAVPVPAAIYDHVALSAHSPEHGYSPLTTSLITSLPISLLIPHQSRSDMLCGSNSACMLSACPQPLSVQALHLSYTASHPHVTIVSLVQTLRHFHRSRLPPLRCLPASPTLQRRQRLSASLSPSALSSMF